MWIVQEVVLAHSLLFASGTALAGWDRVSLLFPHIYAYHCSGPYARAIRLINERRQHIFRVKQGLRPDLHELVQRFGLLDCSDRRDRVFALFGLLKDDYEGGRDILLVDYSLTPAQLSVRILRVAGRSIKHRTRLESIHGWLKSALEVGEHDVDGGAAEELEFVLKQAVHDEGLPDYDEDEDEEESERRWEAEREFGR